MAFSDDEIVSNSELTLDIIPTDSTNWSKEDNQLFLLHNIRKRIKCSHLPHSTRKRHYFSKRGKKKSFTLSYEFYDRFTRGVVKSTASIPQGPLPSSLTYSTKPHYRFLVLLMRD